MRSTSEAALPEEPNKTSAPGPEGTLEQVTVLHILSAILKRWRLVGGVPVVAVGVTGILSVLGPARYTATTTILPETQSQNQSVPSGLAGLASQFGVDIQQGTAPPKFYATVLRSRSIMDHVLVSRFLDPRTETEQDSATLLDILAIEGEGRDTPQRLEHGRKALEKAISIGIDNESNVITLEVETRYPTLSADVADSLVGSLNHFNLETRQSSAHARRSFTEERVTETESELHQAEEALRRFLEQNRAFENSPELRFQHDRLQRQVTIKQEVLITLRREYEQARIQEVNDTPLITVIDGAVPPQRKSSPRPVRNIVVAAFLGTVLAFAGMLWGEYVDRARQNNRRDFQELASRWERIRQGFGLSPRSEAEEDS